MEWKVTKLIVKPEVDGRKNVVAHVQWRAFHGEASKFGTVGLREPGPSFINYDELTEQDALGWVWAAIDKAEVEDSVNPVVLADSVTPAVTSKTLPWG